MQTSNYFCRARRLEWPISCSFFLQIVFLGFASAGKKKEKEKWEWSIVIELLRSAKTTSFSKINWMVCFLKMDVPSKLDNSNCFCPFFKTDKQA